MGSEVRLSPRASDDLETILLYTAREWSPRQAKAYIHALTEGMRLLGEDPSRARSIETLRAGYFLYRVRSHLLVHRRRADFVEIVRILYVRMDVARHF